MQRNLRLIVVLVAVGCGTPDSKDGSNPNSDPNSAQNAQQNSQQNAQQNAVLNAQQNAANNGAVIDPAGYDQSCAFDTECALVTSDVCCQSCANEAIAATALESYSADLSSAAENCGPEDMMCSLAPCQVLVASCAEGTCNARPAVYFDAETWSTQCEIDEDCITIPVGDVCETSCFCAGNPALAISATEAERVQELVSSVTCSPEPGCNCPAIPVAFCNEGTCEVRTE